MNRVNIYTRPRLWDAVSAHFGGEGYFLDAAREVGGPVLELGSGTGRVIAALVAAGFDCVGLDLCPEMTRYASENVPGAQFVTGDMRAFELGRRFNLIFVANNTIQYMNADEDFLDALRSMRAHLQVGGKVILSMINPRPERVETYVEPREAMRFVDPETGRETVIMQTFHFDPETRIGTTVWVHHDRGVPVLEYDFPLVFRTADHVSSLCRTAGLHVDRLDGNHEGVAYSVHESPSMVFTLSHQG